MRKNASATATVEMDDRGRLVVPKSVRDAWDIDGSAIVEVEITKTW
jgi:bifunctional DNA-binding transcriptional regulator/antitoxin component of YhaV-PrlF toxin-antitoxin module